MRPPVRALVLAVLFAHAGLRASSNPRLAVFPVTMNEVDRGEMSVVLEGDDVLLRVSDLETAGVK